MTKPWARNSKHPYEITMTDDTTVFQIQDDAAIQDARFDFVKIRDVRNCEADQSIDLLGIVTNVAPITEITTKKGKPMAKRVLTLQDDSNTSVTNLAFVSILQTRLCVRIGAGGGDGVGRDGDPVRRKGARRLPRRGPQVAPGNQFSCSSLGLRTLFGNYTS